MNPETRDLLLLLAEWFAAIGTLLAVVVALYLSSRDRLIRCLANSTIYSLLDSSRNDSPEFVVLTVTNIGTRSFTMTGMSWRTGIFKRHYFFIVPPQNEYTSRFPVRLIDGEQASIYIPIEAFRTTSLQIILGGRPRFLFQFWVRFMRLVIHTTAGVSVNFKIQKTLRNEILGRSPSVNQ